MLLYLITALAAQTAAEEEIVGFEYLCETKAVDINIPQITGSLTIDESGTPKSFFANFTPSGGQDRVFRDSRPANISKEHTYVSWSLKWHTYNPSYPPKNFALKFENAELQLNFYSWRTLPQNVVMLVGDEKSIMAHWSKPLHAFAERWPGRKTGAPFSFQLQNIFGVAVSSETINWAVYSAPLTANMSYKNLRGEGSIDLKPLRALAKDFDKMREDLLVKATDYRNQCRKETVYYDPNAEI